MRSFSTNAYFIEDCKKDFSLSTKKPNAKAVTVMTSITIAQMLLYLMITYKRTRTVTRYAIVINHDIMDFFLISFSTQLRLLSLYILILVLYSSSNSAFFLSRIFCNLLSEMCLFVTS